MTNDDVSPFDSAALKQSRYTRFFLFFGFLTLFLFAAYFACNGFETPTVWATRAGPVVTVFAILAVQRAQAMGDVLKSDGQFESDEFWKAAEKHKASADRLMWMATSLAIVGALLGLLAG